MKEIIKRKNNKILKKKYGKFYTENYNHIFQSFQLPDYHNLHFIEPFVGKGHLLHFLKEYYKVPLENLNIDYYDINERIKQKESIIKFVNYETKQ